MSSCQQQFHSGSNIKSLQTKTAIKIPVRFMDLGPDFQKILGKILSLAKVFPKFIESYKVQIFTEF